MTCSPSCGWKKVFSAYSPSTTILHSPVIQIEGKLLPYKVNDENMIRQSWILSSQEEYFYQNFIELLSLRISDNNSTIKILRINRITEYWPERLINIYLLGSGAFGTVYQCEDKYTKNDYALKEITSFSEQTEELLSRTILMMTERSAFFRSNDSPFIVKLHGAFQDERLRSYWLVFEFCIGDLKTYLKFISGEILLYLDKMFYVNVMAEYYRVFKEKLACDIEEIGCIFAFELLAGLAYFARRNLLHNDLKPDNVLISAKGHVKISDLGLSQRIKWLDRRSATEQVHPKYLKDNQEEDEIEPRVGNLRYADPETLIVYGVHMIPVEFYKKYKHPDFPLMDGIQNFSSDLYGVALIILDLLFANMNPITSSFLTMRIKRLYFLTSDRVDTDLFRIRCVYDRNVHKDYLLKILKMQYTENTKSVINFLASCFKPRKSRALPYTKEIATRRLKRTYVSRCVDIEKIGYIEYYRDRNITEYNVSNFKLPQAFFQLYQNSATEFQAASFEELLSNGKVRGPGSEIKMTPFEFVT